MTTPALDAALEPFRRVAPLLRDWLAARALAMALQTGLVDALAAGPWPRAALERASGLPPQGLALLLALLGEMVLAEGENIAAAPVLRAALPHRALLQAKLDYAALALPDLHAHLEPLLADRDAFMARAEIFQLFRYDRALVEEAASQAATARWVRITTALSQHEAPVLAALHPWAGVRHLLDLGGNSGETARVLCAASPELRVTIADLPAVCALGRAHLAEAPEAARIAFHPVDLRSTAPPPGPFDAVLLKSVLHDWPEPMAARLIGLAAATLRPGGQLLVFERAPLPAPGLALGYGTVPDLLFHGFYRDAAAYRPMLEAAGLVAETVQTVLLDVPFQLLVAVRPPR